MTDALIHELNELFPGRSKQIETLHRLLGEPSDVTPPAIFIYGHSSSGKTTVLKHLLARSLPRNQFAFINCIERHTPRLIYEHALNQLTGTQPRHENDYCGYTRCEYFDDFVRFLKDACGDGVETRYLVFDRAERLRDMAPTFLPALLKLPELTGKNLCVILISSVVWEKFRAKTGSYEPYLLHFTDYTKQDIAQILAKDCPPDQDVAFFLQFVDVVYDVFHKNCKDLNELRHLVALLFPVYVQPVLDSRVQKTEHIKLFKMAQEYFAEATDKLYLREISSAEWVKRPPNAPSSTLREVTAANAGSGVELPYYTKFLLISSYIASYNPPRLDMRYFAKGREERKGKGKQRKEPQTGGKLRQQLLGPKAFPVERMLAIFYSIIEDPIDNTVDIQTQISSLVSLRLLIRVTSMDRLDTMKLKCNASFELVRQLARSLRFDIERYLYDFY
ncbi:uncharacterized protein VTP21DRAFT_4885 [Calcarisporiella thermophila]|uniref:uncharacterized protein n=1 Tax=Calcarisporiella thermophila TaxID=911321 RepID=UPI003743BE4E